MPAWCSLPNGLSLARLPLALLAVFALLNAAPALAMCVFVVAAATDLADGRIARARNQVTALGGLLDHASDAAFVTLLLAAWSVRGEIPVCLPVLIPLAFMQYVLDSKALAGQKLRGSVIGRWNGVAYFVLAGVPTVRDGHGLDWPALPWVRAMAWGLIASTLLSMGERAYLFIQLRRAGIR